MQIQGCVVQYPKMYLSQSLMSCGNSAAGFWKAEWTVLMT